MDAAEGSSNKVVAITTRLGEILEEVDMGTTTQRQITNKLAEELGEDVYEYKALIREQINKFLARQPAQDDAAVAPANNQDILSEQAAGDTLGDKRKRRADDDSNAEPKLPKPSQGNNEFAIGLSNSRQIRVSKFKGTLYVSIREWYEKDGELAPGKGISLPVPSWKDLISKIEDIAMAVSNGDTEYECKLSNTKQATVKMFKGKTQVDLREYYEKGGELLPGKKGIALDLPQWDKLVEAVPDIDAAIKEQEDPQKGQAKAPASASKGQGAAESTAAAAGASNAKASAAAEVLGQASDLPIQLSAMRKADVADFKGTVYVNIREYYEKDGKQLPGKKGISLPANQFQKLLEAHSALTEALAASNTHFEVPLSDKRKAAISEFRGKLMVNIREFYDKDGQMLPGSKGISLPPEQWHKLSAGLGALNAALKDQTA